MSNPLKPTVEEILKRKVSGHSPERVMWEGAKKKASKHVDTGVFKEHLGPALDALRSYVKGANDVKVYYPKLDERTLKPIRQQKQKVATIIDKYLTIVKNQLKKPNLTAAQKDAWEDLKGQLETREADPTNMTRGLL